MKPDKMNKEPYLFKEMNTHIGTAAIVEQALWQALPKMPIHKKLELEWLEDFMSIFIERLIKIADMTLLSFLNYPAGDIPQDDWESLMDHFINQSFEEVEQLRALICQPLLMRLANGYSKWAENTPLTCKESLYARE